MDIFMKNLGLVTGRKYNLIKETKNFSKNDKVYFLGCYYNKFYFGGYSRKDGRVHERKCWTKGGLETSFKEYCKICDSFICPTKEVA